MDTLFLPFFRPQHNLLPGMKEEDMKITFIDAKDLPSSPINYVSGNLLNWINEIIAPYGKHYNAPKETMTPNTIPVIKFGQVAYAVCPMGASGAPRYRVSGNSEISFMRLEYGDIQEKDKCRSK